MSTRAAPSSGGMPGLPVLDSGRETVLIVGADAARRARIRAAVDAGGWEPIEVSSEPEALTALETAMPSLVVLAAEPGAPSALEVLDALRADAQGVAVPAVVVLPRKDLALTLEAFGRRADDVIAGRVTSEELVARLRVRLDRRPLPRSEVVTDPVTGALTSAALARQIDLELERVARGSRPGTIAFVALDELPGLHARLGARARDELLAQVVALIKADGRLLDLVGFSRGLLVVLLPATPARGAQVRLERLSRRLHGGTFSVGGQPVRVTPLIGYARIEPGLDRERLEDRAWTAMTYEADQLDLHPTCWEPSMSPRASDHGRIRRLFERFRTPVQVTAQQLVCLGMPFGAYVALDGFGIDVTGTVYLVLVAALALTAILIWAECLAAMRRPEPPPAPQDVAPPTATAVIAAYLPNEAQTIVETVEAFLAQDYPDLQVILAYNTPRPLEVERRLRAIAVRDPRFEPLRVEGSVSKAQNVNAALPRVRGEFVGLFDADHHPMPGSFHRAWRWLAGGADVVQGHCVVRNGAQNWLTRLVAAEFEVIYAVSHPGRARLHGFGIFGGSNGYWRAELLEQTRLRGFMLTEDIDSSLRVVQNGGRIVSDPGLVSTELGPDTVSALWNQRLRWAQGWSQVSSRHLNGMVRHFGRRRRLGALHLLGWREVYPWISLQVAPLFAFWFMRGEPPIDWFVPVFVLTTVFTMSAGPAQTWFAYRYADPSIKRHGRWFWLYLLLTTLAYTEVKNVIARTAHVKEAMRERTWKVTPRAVRPATGTPGRERVPDAESAVA
ncbi:MAG: glycosyltransferase [Kineosporiaceae bacterium]